jgi:hypothetical protein
VSKSREMASWRLLDPLFWTHLPGPDMSIRPPPRTPRSLITDTTDQYHYHRNYHPQRTITSPSTTDRHYHQREYDLQSSLSLLPRRLLDGRAMSCTTRPQSLNMDRHQHPFPRLPTCPYLLRPAVSECRLVHAPGLLLVVEGAGHDEVLVEGHVVRQRVGEDRVVVHHLVTHALPIPSIQGGKDTSVTHAKRASRGKGTPVSWHNDKNGSAETLS